MKMRAFSLFWLVNCLAFIVGNTNVCGQSVSSGTAHQLIGSRSCGTTTCHGNTVGWGAKWTHSYSTFVAKDPHSGAGWLLQRQNIQSRKIVESLDPTTIDSEDRYDQVLRKRCISCHTTATPQQCDSDSRLDATFLAAGVSCESCHGAASDWLTPHRNESFSMNPITGGGKSREALRQTRAFAGLRDTKSLIGQVETCVRCHIGSRTDDGMIRDMNHDLIAAGHPALRFDLLLYLENLPKHWSTKTHEADSKGPSSLRVRRVSRSVSLAAAAKLAAQRASISLADPSVPWPELSDYDCFGCHQSLRLKPSRTKLVELSDGFPIWNAWHAAKQFDTAETISLSKQMALDSGNASAVAKSGEELFVRYQNEARRLLNVSHDPVVAIEEMRKRMQSPEPLNWHQAAIDYLDLVAVLSDFSHDPTNVRSIMANEKLSSVEGLLRFGRESESKTPSVYRSPNRFDAAAFRKAVLELIGSTDPP